MAAIKPAQISSFLKNPDKGFEAILVYGPDQGLVTERAVSLTKTLANRSDPPGDIITIDDNDLATDKNRLVVEMQTVAMFGGRKVIRLKPGTRFNPETLDDLLAGGPLESFLVIEAGDLKKSAKLRKIFEKESKLAALPCYVDSDKDLGHLIDEELTSANLKIDREARQHFVNLLGADRALSRSEIEKLKLYASDKTTITIEDIDAVVGDSSALALDNICYAAASGKIDQALKEWDRAQAAGHAPFAVVSALTRHMSRLLETRCEMNEGQSPDQAVRKLRPPIHFKREQAFTSQARLWREPALIKALSMLQETTERTRNEATLEAPYTERLIMGIGWLAKQGS